MTAVTAPSRAGVVRTLGVGAAASIAICNMIGQGVFLKARAMTCNVGSPALMFAAWAVAGVLALCGALTLAELGAAIPESGGLYAFLRRAYGEAVAFSYGWMTLFIAAPASTAALASGAAIFFNLASGHVLDGTGTTFGIAISGMQWMAFALVAVMTALNCAPALLNGQIATAFAGVKIAMLVGVTVAAVVLGHGATAHLANSAANGSCAGIGSSVRGGAAGFAAALVGALYAYNGWHSLTLVAGEIRSPGRTIPLTLVVSVVVVIGLYLAANVAFVAVLGAHAIVNLPASASVGITVVQTLLGSFWRTAAAAFLFASVAATLHVTILTTARVTYALSRDGVGLDALARVSKRGHVPVNAVLLNGGLAVVLVLAGSFDTLSDYLVFNSWVYFVAIGAALFVLRRREPLLERPYRLFGYPFVPAMYIAVGGWLVVQTAIASPVASVIGLTIVAVSFPVYAWRSRRRRAA